MIEIYPSTLPGEPIERHEVSGLSLHDWLVSNVAGYRPGPTQPISASIDGRIVPPERWHELMIAPSVPVQLRVQPKDPITAIVIGIAVSLVAMIVMKPKVPNVQQRQQGAKGSQIAGVNATANLPRMGEPIPEIAGRHRIYPDYLTQPRRIYTDYKTQGLRMLLCLGKGEFEFSNGDIKIGETPITALGQSVTVGVYGPGQTIDPWSSPGISSQIWYHAPEVGGTRSAAGIRIANPNEAFSGPFLACPKGEKTSWFQIDMLASDGLGYINDDGSISNRTIYFDIQYRDHGTGNWIAAPGGPVYLYGNTRDQVGRTFDFTLPAAITPEVRIRRSTAYDNRTQAMDKVLWSELRSHLGVKSTYPGCTVIALVINGSNAISALSEEKISVTATRKLPELDGVGGWTAPVATRQISSWAAYVAKSIGYTDAELDLDELARLESIWSPRADYFDFIFAKEGTVKNAINSALSAGFAELTIDRGRIRPVRDELRTVFEHMYTPQNMTKALRRSFEAPQPDEADGVDVEFVNSETWTKETVKCRLAGDGGFKVEKLTLDGVTDRTRAWRIGMRLRRAMKYRRWSYRFATELDALNSRYLSYCALADDVPGYGQSAWIKSVSDAGGGTARLMVSEPLQWTEGASHVLAWRRADGTLAGPYPATAGGDDYQVLVTMPTPWPDPDARQEPPHILFGTSERWSYPALIKRINPQGMETVSVEAENYDARVYEDDDNAPS